jgi:hypothetical protein
MVEERQLPATETVSPVVPEPVEFPLRVVPDWDEQARQGDRLAKLIDRHLEYEAYSRNLLEAEQLTPIGLCPEQRVNLLTDMFAITRQTST